MKKSVKAALFSGLVFPGLGQIYLKRYRRGIAIILVMLASLGFLIGTIAISMLENIKKLQGQGPLDMSDISKLAATLSAGQALSYNAGLLLVVCCWLFSIIDAYRIGRVLTANE